MLVLLWFTPMVLMLVHGVPSPCTKPQVCVNGGGCQRKASRDMCVCGPGFTGDHCQIEAPPCDLTKDCLTLNSVCTHQHCHCRSGFSGDSNTKCQWSRPCQVKDSKVCGPNATCSPSGLCSCDSGLVQYGGRCTDSSKVKGGHMSAVGGSRGFNSRYATFICLAILGGMILILAGISIYCFYLRHPKTIDQHLPPL